MMTSTAKALVRRLGTALIRAGWHPYIPQERKRPSEHEARLLAGAYEEGAYNAARRIVAKLLPHDDVHLHAIRLSPSYCELRDFLISDCDADDRIARRVAFAIVEGRQRYLFPRDHDDRERGWI